MKKFRVIGWIITVPLQVVIGYLAGFIALIIGGGAMPISIVFLWLGTTLGVFLIGALAILLRRAIRAKKYPARLGGTALGVIIPLAIMLAIGLSQGFDSDALNSGLGLILPILATILGLFGFYIPGWIKGKSLS